jgi:cytochrome c peroxidase
MSPGEKRGALLFFGSAGCVSCHAVGGASNEMFSDFAEHVVGAPQIAPAFGTGSGNVLFDGAAGDEDFGLEEITGNRDDRYKFRTAPLRNLAVAPGFFHNGAFTDLADAVRFHLNAIAGARTYDAIRAGVPADLVLRLGPPIPVKLLDPAVREPTPLNPQAFEDLVNFVRNALHDPRVSASTLCRLVPSAVPSGMPVPEFEACR